MDFFKTLRALWTSWECARAAAWAQTHLRHSDYERAIRAATHALDADAPPLIAYFARGRARARCGDWAGALADFNTCIDALPHGALTVSRPATAVYDDDVPPAAVYAYRAWIHWELGALADAMGDANLALYYDPRQSIAADVRGKADAVQGARWGWARA
jgi:tetratricopeptide (TPR) repeat protein